MSDSSRIRTGPRVLAVLTALGAAVAGAALGHPAAVAAPADDCATAYPVSALTRGQAVTGLSVSRGTTPEGFTGEVIGVLEDGIGPGLDMVMVDLSSPELARVGGIWQGMSGSPVYATDGRLIGAVAYGLAFGASPVAGVTPFEDMDDRLVASPRRVTLPRAQARLVAERGGVSPREAAQGFEQLPMPLTVSGVSRARLAQYAGTGRPYLRHRAAAAGPGSAAAAGPDTVVAGGNLAATLAYGDVTLGGVGTATSVCRGRVVGFGHPLNFAGSTTMSLHPAEALYVQEDPLGVPFKVANFGAPAGTVTDDRLTGIAGAFGAPPSGTTVTSTVAYRSRSRTGTTRVTVPQATAEAVFGQLLGNHDRVVDGVQPGTEVQTRTFTGTDETGTPFTVRFSDRYTSASDLTFEASFDPADLAFALTGLPGVRLDSITVDSRVGDATDTWRVKRIQQRRKGEWVSLGRGEAARAKAGGKLRLRALVGSATGTRAVPLRFSVPRRASGSSARLYVTGGNALYADSFVTSVAKAKALAASYVRNDELVAQLTTAGGPVVGGGEEEIFRGRPGGPAGFDKSRTLGPYDRVVDGARRVKVIIR